MRGKTAKGKKWSKALTKLVEKGRQVMGFEDLRFGQDEALELILKKKDVLAIMPTGSGKSLIYQLPSLQTKGAVVVVSPLIALIKDQVDKMNALGVPACRMDSTLTVRQLRANTEFIKEKGGKLIITTPERLTSPDFLDLLNEACGGDGVSIVAIDEAHCVSQWGHDFRPAFLSISKAIETLGQHHSLSVIATTATAPPHVRSDILSQLNIPKAEVVTTSFDRANLHYEVISVPSEEAKDRTLIALLKRLPRPGVVYCATVKAVERVHESLARHGLPVAMYHGRMSKKNRDANQNRFMEEGNILMVATNAFGLGVDKRNIRNVVHYHVPGSLEAYAQEAGRGGRDRKPTRCVLLFSPDDVAIQEFFLKGTYPTKRQVRSVFRTLEVWDHEEIPATIKNIGLASKVGAQRTRTILSLLKGERFVKTDKETWSIADVPPDPVALNEKARYYESRRISDRQRLDSLLSYVSEAACRSRILLSYLGESETVPCGRCDNCLRSAEDAFALADKAYELEQDIVSGLDNELGAEEALPPPRLARHRVVRIDRETGEPLEELEEEEYEWVEEVEDIEQTAASLLDRELTVDEMDEIRILARKKSDKPVKRKKKKVVEVAPDNEGAQTRRRRRRRRRKRKKVIPEKGAFNSPVLTKQPKPSRKRGKKAAPAPLVEYVRGPLRINMSPVASATPNDSNNTNKRRRKKKKRRNNSGQPSSGPVEVFASTNSNPTTPGQPSSGKKRRRRRRKRKKKPSDSTASSA